MAKSRDFRKIFLDTNFIVGLYAVTDPLHEKCLTTNQLLSDNFPKSKLLISNYVLAEVLTVLSLRAGKNIALACGKQIFESGFFTILQHQSSDDNETWSLFQEPGNKNISYVDIAIVQKLRSEGINFLVTFDKQLAKLAKSFKIKVLQP